MAEKVYEELDDAKVEIEKLRSENLVTENLCETLKRSNSDQLKRIKELDLKLEKQGQEIEAKADEAYAAKRSLEDVECKLKEKENVIASFTSANDKLRADFSSKLRECEAEKEKLVLLLEEANAKVFALEDENRAFMDKIEVLKEGIVSVSQKKCASESKMTKASQHMRERGDMFEKLEEEKMKLEEELKWKNEQFRHLEEAHEKVRSNLRMKEKEWDMEKGTFFDDISTLETKLDSQITLSEDLKRRLELCKQAVAREEDRRKCLENQLSESNSCFVDMKSKLEEENQELVRSLKELKESQIREASNSPIVKLQNKIKTLEETNTVREAEWTSRFEKIIAELNCCRLESESKETRLKAITAQADEYNSLVLNLTMEKEEFALMTVALKSTLLETRWKMDDEKLLLHNQLLQMKNELKNVCEWLDIANEELDETRLKAITAQVDEYNSLLLDLTMEKEEFALMVVALKSTLLETRSKMDDEKLLLHNQLLQTKNELKNVCEMLDIANEELDEMFCEVNGVEFELQTWKSVAEKLESDLEVNHRTRREVEASLLAQVATEVNLKEDLKEKETRIINLEQQIRELKEEWVAKELEAAILAQLEAERIHECEKQNLNQLVEEKDQRINNLQQIMSSLEQEFDESTASFSSQLARMQVEMKSLHEAWEKMRTTVVLKEIEVQEKGLMITELEKDLDNRVRFVKKCLKSIKKLSSENKKLMNIIDGASEWINKLSREDGQVMGTWRSIMSGFDENHGEENGCLRLRDRFYPVKENINVHKFSSPKGNIVENSGDERSPLRTMNG